MPTVRRRVVAHGRVQGVWFRESVRQRADARGVAGSVRNTAEGTVEAVFEGEPGAVEALVDYCRRGPEAADVDRVDVADEKPEGLSGFRVS